eukprot:5027558-Pyramimonas_sp.AAC.1
MSRVWMCARGRGVAPLIDLTATRSHGHVSRVSHMSFSHMTSQRDEGDLRRRCSMASNLNK